MSPTTVVALAILTAGIAGLRSTWSPCSLSMLSMVTPSGEASRGHRYSLTATWFVLGAIAGGAILGAAIAALAAVVHQLAPGGVAVAVTVVAAASLTVGSDLRVGGFSLPRIPRQVDELWLNRYRGWVYGAGYGAQIGVGLSTYVMTAAVYLMIVLGVLTGRPLVGLLVGLGFGTCRGLALLLGARLRDPSAAHVLHARLETAATWSLGIAVAGQVVVLAVGVSSLGAAMPAGVAAALVLAVLASSRLLATRLTSTRRSAGSAR